MGNSEVGHLTLGSGQILLQDLPRISKSIEQNTLGENEQLQDLIKTLKKTGGACHLMGLISPGGVHSHSNHIKAVISILSHSSIPVHVHAFLDGRDTPPKSGEEYIKELLEFLKEHPLATLSTLSGRYYAMDRDQNWDRIEPAYKAIVNAQGPSFKTPLEAIKTYYEQNISDEFMPPCIIPNYKGVHAKDVFLMANFRADRVRQLLQALVIPSFKEFTRTQKVYECPVYGMTHYADWLTPYIKTLFPPQKPSTTLGAILEKNGLTQYRIAETEKYAHVTYFFNGGREAPYQGEFRQLVPSPKVATYDLKPEMAAHQVTDLLCEAIDSKAYDFLLVNYANPDMVGHTGHYQATLKAIETVDACLARLEETTLKNQGVLIITADHGNADCMLNVQTQKPHTAHTCAPVPFLLVGQHVVLHSGPAGLADVTPTLLDLLNLKNLVPLSGTSLLAKE
jgi:2,3-bisphosphoglycerate-independent phosphoglycerate mutase